MSIDIHKRVSVKNVGEDNPTVDQSDSRDGGWPSFLRLCILLNKNHIVRNRGAA